MIDLIICSFIISLLVVMQWSFFQPNMIFWDFVPLLEKLPEKAGKPLYGCIICMAPWWGQLWLTFICLFTGYDFGHMFPSVLIATGINVFLAGYL